VYCTCDDLDDIFCAYAGNRTAVHICIYDDLELILNADELQALLTIYDWFMENISNPKFDWTMHPGSNIAPTVIKKSAVPTTSFKATATKAIVPTTTTATTTVIEKSYIPTESTIPITSFNTTATKAVVPTILTTAIHAEPTSSATRQTTTLVLPTLRLSLKPLAITCCTNHQIVPTQQSLLALEYTIFVTTTYKLFDPGGIMFAQTESPCFICLQTFL
jgi:hypothetical protein